MMHRTEPEDTKQGLFVHVGGTGGMDMRTARLNAAAPKLLAALRELLPFTDCIQDAGPGDEGWKSDALLKAIADAEQAIAEATESPDPPITDECGRPMTYWGGKAAP